MAKRFATCAAMILAAALALLPGAAVAKQAGTAHCFDAATLGSGPWTCVDSYTLAGQVHQYGQPGFSNPAILPDGETTVTPPTQNASSGVVPLTRTYSWPWSATVYYGNGSERIGSDYETAKINLNGRQSQISMSIQVLSGPLLKPTLSWACNACGSGGASSASYVATYNLPSGQSGFSSFDAQYYDQFTWSFLASGYGTERWTNPVVTSATWTCNAIYTQVCYFGS